MLNEDYFPQEVRLSPINILRFRPQGLEPKGIPAQSMRELIEILSPVPVQTPKRVLNNCVRTIPHSGSFLTSNCSL